MQSARDARDAEEEEVDEEEEEKLSAPTRRKHQLPLSAQSAFSYIPPGRRDPQEVSYFHREAKETARLVTVLSSSDYGRRIKKPVEQLIRDHARINHVQAEFYRKNGITCLLEKPSPSLDPC